MKILASMVPDDFEQVVFVVDEPSGLSAIMVIHDTTLGPAMGGVRIQDSDERAALTDVLRLARTMTLKASAAGLNLGGGGAIILADPNSPTGKSEARLRAFGRRLQGLGGRLFVAEDVGSDVEDMEQIACETSYVAGLARSRGGSGNPALQAARGVFRGIQACLEVKFGDPSLRGRTVAVEGVGAVGLELARLLIEDGARLLVADIDPKRIDKARALGPVEVVSPDRILTQPCDVVSPCALGGIITAGIVAELKAGIIAGCANNQLADGTIGKLLFDRGILYAPDFLINAGGLINAAEELTGYNEVQVGMKITRLYDRVKSVLTTAAERKIPTDTAARDLALERIATLREVRRTWAPPVARRHGTCAGH